MKSTGNNVKLSHNEYLMNMSGMIYLLTKYLLCLYCLCFSAIDFKWMNWRIIIMRYRNRYRIIIRQGQLHVLRMFYTYLIVLPFHCISHVFLLFNFLYVLSMQNTHSILKLSHVHDKVVISKPIIKFLHILTLHYGNYGL